VVPPVYLENQLLHDKLAFLQKELDTAKIIADKAETTGKKLCKQRDLRKIHHRRIQQEKDKLNAEIEKLKDVYEKDQKKFADLSEKYEKLRSEKMLLDFQRKGIVARCDQLDKGLKRLEEAVKSQKEKEGFEQKLKEEVSKKGDEEKKELRPAKEPTPIPDEIMNPNLDKRYDPLNLSLTVLRSRKGHMLSVSSVAVSPKKDIFATGSDDSTWKLWTLPQGDLIMCGEGHQVLWYQDIFVGLGQLDIVPSEGHDARDGLGRLLDQSVGPGDRHVQDHAARARRVRLVPRLPLLGRLFGLRLHGPVHQALGPQHAEVQVLLPWPRRLRKRRPLETLHQLLRHRLRRQKHLAVGHQVEPVRADVQWTQQRGQHPGLQPLRISHIFPR
jgi:hypothetical protein